MDACRNRNVYGYCLDGAAVDYTLGAIGTPHFGDAKGWLLVAAAAGLGYAWKGPKGSALLGLPALVILGLVSAQAGNAMFQFLPPPHPAP